MKKTFKVRGIIDHASAGITWVVKDEIYEASIHPYVSSLYLIKRKPHHYKFNSDKEELGLNIDYFEKIEEQKEFFVFVSAFAKNQSSFSAVVYDEEELEDKVSSNPCSYVYKLVPYGKVVNKPSIEKYEES